MSGFGRSTSVNINENLEKHLICGICRNVLNNAVTGDCGHNFCKECIESWIRVKQNSCPECRKGFRKGRKNRGDGSDVRVIIGSNVFIRNLTINSIINEFEPNGCQQLIGSVPEHLEQHGLCQMCGLYVGNVNKHKLWDCLELLKKDRNERIAKFEELNRKLNQSRALNRRGSLNRNSCWNWMLGIVNTLPTVPLLDFTLAVLFAILVVYVFLLIF